ncbi:hypothetical protein M6D81_14690 [Paenibacillus sp. J5C_2022]|uniref:glycoside hydrolase family 2 TIM barrel-domain containing protein n=1 Tax=Paenibacillus sp. J5C2022 TaxID=2977129 RepID=UPI0021D2239F|nr:glycoside hydrolase family 2 TIM barrel-domain containing protein [Paenibacillus sp. J5C2022]MCU6709940.1 hypothetical protein [Paenibacillus sp. J5C2022]
MELDIHEQNEIEELYFCTIQADQHKAHMTVHYQLQIDPENFGEMEIRCSGQCGDSAFELKRRVNFRAGAVEIEIDKPMLWWPRGYGQASLYKVRTQLLLQGKVVAERQDTIGIRTVELIRTDVTGTENPGEFLFKVNDVPIFCKGSNWVPADVFHSRDASRYERILELFRETECNMVRCWGGNVYEDHAFFELCNEYGLMVWQDFALACGFYPQTIDFQQVIREEAMSVIKKLRNHPSIVLWCGDNEIDIFCYYKGLDPAFNKINREVLAEVAFQCDPRRPYLPSSPYFSPSAIAQKQERLVPEAHLWGPRDYYKSKFYTDSPHHFVSEIGYHGCPNVSSMKQFIDAESLWPYQDNEQWTTHCSDPIGLDGPYAYRVKLMADQIKELFGVSPDNLEDFVLASQISQAEAKKFFIEMTRIKKWRRTGIVWWNMMDGWPQFSDAVVDYYFGKKLAYHYIKRAQEPVCIMIDEPHNWHVQVMISNDTRLHASGDYKIWDADSGQSLLEGNFHAGANTNLNLGKIRVSNGEQRLFLMQWTMEGKTYGNHYMLGYPPFSLDTYKRWLFDIAALQADFQADAVGK